MKYVPCLEINEAVSVHCNILSKGYHHNSIALYTFVPHKSLGQWVDISPTNFIILKYFNSDCSYNEVWFTDQNSKPLQI